MSDFVNKVSNIFKEAYGCNTYAIISKHCYTKNQSENNVEIMDITESTSVHPLIEQDSPGGRSITIDTETETVFEVITKPEEAGGK